MRLPNRFKRSYANVAATVAIVIAVGGGAYAATNGIPGPKGVVHGCFKMDGGRLRVVEKGTPCRDGERAIKWNQRGEPGSVGLRGAPGPRGLRGLEGEQGPQGEPMTAPEGGTVLRARTTCTTAPGCNPEFAIPGVGELTIECRLQESREKVFLKNTSGHPLDSFMDLGDGDARYARVEDGFWHFGVYNTTTAPSAEFVHMVVGPPAGTDGPSAEITASISRTESPPHCSGHAVITLVDG